MRAVTVAAVLACVVVPAWSGAEELDLGWFGSAEYDDNVFNTDETGEATDDVALRTGPIIGLRRRQGDVTYDLRYEPRYETFVDQSGLDEFDHSLFGRLRWRLSPNTDLTVTERFNVTHSMNRSTFVGDPEFPDLAPEPEIEVARQEIIRNSVRAELAHDFTPRLSGTLAGGYGIFRTDREDRFENDDYDARGELLYRLTNKSQIGGGASVSYQDYDDIVDEFGMVEEGQDSVYYSAFFSWIYTFDPTMTLSVRAGPSWFDSDEADDEFGEFAVVPTWPTRREEGGTRFLNSETCPTDGGFPYVDESCETFPHVLGPGDLALLPSTLVPVVEDRTDDGNDLTAYASVQLIKRWERFRGILAYTRSDSNSSGVGQSTIVDAMSIQGVWEPTARWTVSMILQASLRQSTVDQERDVLALAPATVAFIRGINPITMLPIIDGPFPASKSVALRLVDADSNVDVTTYTAQLRVKRSFGRRAEVFGNLYYVWQDSEGTAVTRKFDNFRAMLGARWMFDPINVM